MMNKKTTVEIRFYHTPETVNMSVQDWVIHELVPALDEVGHEMDFACCIKKQEYFDDDWNPITPPPPTID